MKLFSTTILFPFFALLFLPFFSFSQDTLSVSDEKSVEEKIENIASSTEEDVDYTVLLDNLEYYKKHPINLNSTSNEELHRLGVLLNDLQINALLQHVEKNGKFLSVYELQVVDGFDLETIFKIVPYIKVNNDKDLQSISFREIFKNGEHTYLVRTEKVLEKSTGYFPQDTAPAVYLGSPYKIYNRYRFNYKNQIYWGITGEKDAGEEFFKGSQRKGFDFYSAHFFARNIGAVKAFAVGDYQLQYGQGLVLWSGLTFGKTSDVINIGKYAEGISPYISTNENLFMRGASTAVGFKNFQLDVFYSKKKIDANITSIDSLSNEVLAVSSFQTSGYHRTIGELQDKHAINMELYGSHLSFKNKNLNVGITAVKTLYGADLTSTTKLYNQFDFSGNSNANLGLDYNYSFRNFHFFGEAAKSQSGGIAYLNGILIGLDARASLAILHRSYTKDYQALLSHGFGEGYTTANEQGLYLGFVSKLSNSLTLSGYYDVFEFPWLNYRVNAPSKGYDYLAQLTYTPSKTVSMYLKYKEKSKQQNTNESIIPIDYLTSVTQRNIRWNMNYKISSFFTFGNRIEISSYQKENTSQSTGYLIFQDIAYKVKQMPLSFSMRYVLFDIDSYDARIYAYENGISYIYSIPSYYDRGNGTYISTHYRIKQGIDFWLYYGQTVYTNRKNVGSGLNEIQGNTKSEVKAQMKFVF